MKLTLTVEGQDQLDNGLPASVSLEDHGLIIGRSPHVDWSLPDPRNYISSTHAEIDWRGGDQYLLIDKSTNGTFLNGATQRLTEPYALRDGDLLGIGHYRVRVSLGGSGAGRAASPPPARGSDDTWGDWTSADTGARPPAPPPPPPPQAPGDWGDDTPVSPPGVAWTPSSGPSPASPPPGHAWTPSGAGQPSLPPIPPPPSPQWEDEASEPGSATSGRGSGSWNWNPPGVNSPPPPAAPPPVPAEDAWSPGPPPATPPGGDIWDQFTNSNAVDWRRGGFDEPPAPPPSPAPPPAPPPEPSPAGVAPPPQPPGRPELEAAWIAFLTAAGFSEADLKTSPVEASQAAGHVLRRLVAGLVVMLEARARAKAQLGASGTILELDGNNPLKFARDPSRVLLQLLNPPERGFMPAEKAVHNAFQDLQAHQMATVVAMQNALRSTLDRFSPTAIRGRAETGGFLTRILPGARDAALWQAYEREFDGVARGSDEAFLDVFAKAFRRAYEEAAVSGPRPRL
jgi:type VI secretion system protein